MYDKDIDMKIYERLFYHYYRAIARIPEDRVIGAFAYGSMNYNLYDPEKSDVDTKLIILPSKEDLFYSQYASFSSGRGEIRIDNEICSTKDIRVFLRELKKGCITSMELLYTPFSCLNPQHEKFWKEILQANRENICYADKKQVLNSTLHNAQSSLRKKELKSKDIASALRLTTFCKKYLDSMPIQNCLMMEGEEEVAQWIKSVKYGEYSSDELRAWAVSQQSVVEDLFELRKQIIDTPKTKIFTELQENVMNYILKTL